jgi:hypothetical protein
MYGCPSCGEMIHKNKLFYNDPFLVSTHLYAKAVENSTKYAEENMKDCMLFFDEKNKYFDYAVSKIKNNGIFAEFGVWTGTSINYISALCKDKVVYGFDSFYGLQEDWGGFGHMKGHFGLDGNMPNVNQNVVLIKGYFKDTVKNFTEDNNDPFAFINFDCDTYESTKCVLDLIGPKKIISGTIVSFDEYFGYWGWENHEYKAWQEFCSLNGIRYKYLAINHMCVLIEVL